MRRQQDSEMSFAQTYMLASTVRSKLTKEAANPNSSLRVLVSQANMLDNIMDSLAEKTEARMSQLKVSVESDDKHVSFKLPGRQKSHLSSVSTNVTEYEVDPESDSDDFSDSDSDADSDSDDYSDSEDEEEAVEYAVQLGKVQSFRQLPSMNLSLSPIEESQDMETEDLDVETIEVPDLSRSPTLTDEEDIHESNYKLTTTKKTSAERTKPRSYGKKSIDEHFHDNDLTIPNRQEQYDLHHHERHNAVYSIENIF